LTGGEPLLQEESPLLIKTLLDEGYEVLVETSGSVPVKNIDSRAVIIMDIKCPGSEMDHATLWENLAYLKDRDEVKFVIADRADYDWAKDILKKYSVLQDKIIYFSPVFGQMPAKELAEWILEEKLSVRFQIQMHKYIWDAAMKGI
jgi:7-carboxy-7-deazaguanine synthase